MNPKQLIAAVAMFAATGAVFAQATEYVNPAANFVSTKTRAQVYEELKQAQANGTYVTAGSEDFPGQTEILARSHRISGEATGLARDSKPQSNVSGS
jgi:hypothetical protein